ncbi:MAG: rhodanese-like domain-containing protein [Ignavibacteriaceae bacterium]|nr:rhodanese-like domain-containing protein [Ignavibacteriaceae bacterium]
MINRIEPPAAADALKRESNAILLDVREQWEYDIVHIENSVLIPLRNLKARMSELRNFEKIYVICHHGFRSLPACELLFAEGIPAVYNVEGGIERWADEADTSLKKY